MKLFEVTWTETRKVKLKASIEASSEGEAIEMVDSGYADNEEVVGYDVTGHGDWQAVEI